MRALLIILLSVVLVGCASSGSKQIAREDAQTVQEKIHKGVTTKTEITQMFGRPSGVTVTSEGKESWVYAFSKVKVHGSSFIPFYGLFKNGSDVTVKQLIVVYNGDIVEEYTMTETSNTTQSGLVQ